MDIILIVPPFANLVARKGFEMTRPLGVFCLAAALNKAGHKTRIKHFEKDNEGVDRIEAFLKNNRAPVYGITATTATRFGAIAVAKGIKKLYPDSRVVVGGPHFSNCAEDSLNTIPEIDVVVKGEGDHVLVELLHAIEAGLPLSRVAGISFRKDGAIFNTPDAPVITDLDALPVYQDFDYQEYRETLFVIEEKVPAISILTSRGCSYQCIFCSVNNSGYRFRSPGKVVDEIELWLKKFPFIKGINFFDLTFTANAEHAKNVCNEIIRRGLNIRWWAESRVNVDPELLKLMKKAGCAALSAGVESGSPRVLQRISKAITIPQVKEFVTRCISAGIEPSLFFMVSFPDETEDDLLLTRTLISDLLPETRAITMGVTSIYPGTRLERIAREKRILDNNFSWSQPYYSDVADELSAYPDIPVFIDKLTPRTIDDFLVEVRALRFKSKIGLKPLHYLKRAIELLFEPGKDMRYKIKVAGTFLRLLPRR